MLNEKIIQGINGNIKNIVDRSYTCVNKDNKCFEFVLNDKIYMIYLINNQIYLTELVLDGCCFNEIDIMDNVSIEEIKMFFTNNSTEMAKNNIINFVKNSKQYKTLTLKMKMMNGHRIIESIFHCGDDAFEYSIDKIETNQIISLKSIKNLKNINEVLEVIK